MSQTKCLSLVAGAGVSLFAVAANADTTTSYTQVNSDEVRAIVSETLADADTRSSLLAGGGNAGHDANGFFISDGQNFRLSIGGQIAFRYFLNFRSTSGNGNANLIPPTAFNPNGRLNDDFESGFQTSNTRVWFDGNVVDPNLFYHIVGDFSASTGSFILEEAYSGYKWDNGFSFQWGQFKLPFLREELVPGWYQLCADRSLVNSNFGQGYSQGIMAGYSSEDFRMSFAFSDGFQSANSQLGTVSNAFGQFAYSNIPGTEADWAITTRGEFKFAGTWDQFKQFTGLPGTDFGCMLGVAAHYEQSANSIQSTFTDPVNGTVIASEGRTGFGGWTADLNFQGDGWNLMVEGLGLYTNNTDNAAALNQSVADYGLVLQGGIFIPGTNWEFFHRTDIIWADTNRFGSNNGASNSFTTLTFGMNYYYAGQAAKFTFDVEYYIDSSFAGNQTANDTQIGYFGNGQDGECTLRFQFQLLF